MTPEAFQMIMARLDRIEAELSGMFLFFLIISVGAITYLNDFKNRHALQNLAATSYRLVVKEARKLYKPRKNLGVTETRPDALPLLEKYVAEYWLTNHPRIMEFTESVWLPIIRAGNFTRPDWKPLTERWKSYGFLVQKDPSARTGKGTALIVNKYRLNGMERKLYAIASLSPAPVSSMPKAEENPA